MGPGQKGKGFPCSLGPGFQGRKISEDSGDWAVSYMQQRNVRSEAEIPG